jgi:hypothetical protein
MNKAILACCLAVFVCGCSTPFQTNNSVMSEGPNHVYKDYVIDVTSDPPGAKVDWNGKPAGVTPFQRVLNGRRGMCAPAAVTAHTPVEGKRCQTQRFDGCKALPRVISFDFTK